MTRRSVYACVWPVFPDALEARIALFLAAPAHIVAIESILHLVTSSHKRWWRRRWAWLQRRWLWRRGRRPVCVACRSVYACVWPVFPDALGAVVALLLAAPARKVATESLILHLVTSSLKRRRRWPGWPGWRQWRRVEIVAGLPGSRPVFIDAPGTRVALCRDGHARKKTAEPFIEHPVASSPKRGIGRHRRWRRRYEVFRVSRVGGGAQRVAAQCDVVLRHRTLKCRLQAFALRRVQRQSTGAHGDRDRKNEARLGFGGARGRSGGPRVRDAGVACTVAQLQAAARAHDSFGGLDRDLGGRLGRLRRVRHCIAQRPQRDSLVYSQGRRERLHLKVYAH